MYVLDVVKESIWKVVIHMKSEALKNASRSTWTVLVWVAVSAALTAALSYLLEKPEYAAYYGVINVVLYMVKELNREYRAGK